MIKRFDSIPLSDAIVTMVVLAICIALIMILSGLLSRNLVQFHKCDYVILKNLTKIVIYLRCS